MGTLTYNPATDYTKLILLGNGDPTATELLPDGVTVSNVSLSQVQIDQAFLDYNAGLTPPQQLEAAADNVLSSILLAQGVMGDPIALSTISVQLGLTRPSTIVQNTFAPPVVGAGANAPTTLLEAQIKRKTELTIEFSNLMQAGTVIRGFKIKTELHNLQKWRASIDLVVYSGYSNDNVKDADGIYQTVSKRDMSKIMTKGYQYYRDNLDAMQTSLLDVDNTTTITAAGAVVAVWV